MTTTIFIFYKNLQNFPFNVSRREHLRPLCSFLFVSPEAVPEWDCTEGSLWFLLGAPTAAPRMRDAAQLSWSHRCRFVLVTCSFTVKYWHIATIFWVSCSSGNETVSPRVNLASCGGEVADETIYSHERLKVGMTWGCCLDSFYCLE
jgi:hypothetical protein